MEGISKELIDVLRYLLPGFVAAWVFYGLTAHPKPGQFERVVQALIFTFVVQWALSVTEWLLCFFGRHAFAVGPWSDEVSGQFWSLVIALGVGLVSARFANNNALHRWLWQWPWYEKQRESKRRDWQKRWLPAFVHLPKWEWTCRTSYPSEWYAVFSTESRYIVLHLTGKRRLYGWPELWPDQPGQGHFVMQEPRWLLENGEMAPLIGVKEILVSAADVEMVEFIWYDSELSEDQIELRKKVQQLLIDQQSKGAADVSKIPTNTAADADGPHK